MEYNLYRNNYLVVLTCSSSGILLYYGIHFSSMSLSLTFEFTNTSKDAISSANIYSIVESAKANKLVVEIYLVYLIDRSIR